MREDRDGVGRWLGAAALVAGLGLAALAAQPRGGDDAGPHLPGTAGDLVTAPEVPPPARRAVAPPPAPRPLPSPGASGPVARGEWRGGGMDAPGGAPEIRLPSDLEPVRPDVVVALPPTEPGLIVPPHAHVTARAEGRTPHALGMVDAGTAMQDATRDADGTEGPEPGALYWFGPDGLVKVQVLMEAQR